MPEDEVLHSHRCENLRSYIDAVMLLSVEDLTESETDITKFNTANTIKMKCEN
jgi:hypothetical protein